MNQERNSVRRQLNIITFIAVLAIVTSIALGAYVLTTVTQSKKLIITEGIIIKGINGNDRILIGAPIPASADRVRTDSVKAWDTYIKKWPEKNQAQVWEWFKDYNHSSNGILFLSETGHDRISIGDPTPDPTIGKRIAPGTGIVLMDEHGYERSGYSVMNFDGNYRVVLGLDTDKGSEGLALIVDDNGYSGLLVPGKDDYLFLGNSDTSFYATQPYEKFIGFIKRNRDSILIEIQ